MKANLEPRNKYKLSSSSFEGDKYMFKIGDFIDKGGNGILYSCFEVSSGVEYAVKFLQSFKGDDKKRFSQEIELLAKIKNQFIINFIDSGEARWQYSVSTRVTSDIYFPFYVMEKADRNLRDYLQMSPQIEHTAVLGRIRGLLEALVELHKYAIHRDLKPENILVSGDDWMVGDLGLSKANRNPIHVTNYGNRVVGPAFWSSPEALTSYYSSRDMIDQRSDIYQLAMILWFILNRKVPGGVLCTADWNSKLSQSFYDVLFRALQFDPSRRFQTASDFLKAWNDSIDMCMIPSQR
jgi:serine/threonine-protein kinase